MFSISLGLDGERASIAIIFIMNGAAPSGISPPAASWRRKFLPCCSSPGQLLLHMESAAAAAWAQLVAT